MVTPTGKKIQLSEEDWKELVKREIFWQSKADDDKRCETRE